MSVDTWKPPVAEAALAAGAHVFNDVSGPARCRPCPRGGADDASLVVMHTRAEPKVEHFADYGGDVVEDVVSFVRERCALALAEGVAADAADRRPGPGLREVAGGERGSAPGRSTRCRARAIRGWRRSRASTSWPRSPGRPPAERLAGTLAAVGYAADRGAAMVRVHDVAATVDFLAVRAVLHGVEEIGAFDADDDALKWIRATPSS